MSNNFKQEIDKIEIPTGLHERVKLGVKKAKSEKPKGNLKRIAIPLVASMFVVFTTGVVAAKIPSFNNFVATVSPEIALMLQPIEIRSEDNGINMEVVAAMNDDEMAVIYVTLQDLSANRIDETLDLYDYSLSGAHMFNSQIVDYDETTNTAMLRIQGNGGDNLNNQKVNFRINSFLSHKQTFEVPVNANLLELTKNPTKTIELEPDNISGSGGKLINELSKQGKPSVLKPDKTKITLPEINFMHISNIGIIDNRLHIQTKWDENNVDEHGYFYFVDDIGNEIHPSSINFRTDDAGGTNNVPQYIEYIFEKGSVDFQKYKLLGHFVSNGNYTTGNWNATFKMKSVQDEIDSEFKKNFGTWSSKSISVSPLGVTIHGNGKFNDSTNIEVSAKMTDGSVQTFDSMRNFSDNDDITVKLVPSLPLELSKVKTIHINGTEINLK